MSYVMSYAMYLDSMSYTTISCINFRIRYRIQYRIRYDVDLQFPFFGGVASPDPGRPDVCCVPLQQLPALRFCFGKDTILDICRQGIELCPSRT